MRDEPGQDKVVTAGNKRSVQDLQSSGAELQKKSWIALALYGVLAALIWFTMDAGKVQVWGKPVELRLVPLIIIGGLALRTVLALQADKIRHSREKDS
jgi:cytochrome bd-type quinol oxidase subunit 2